MWHWDQGRLEYFQFDSLRKIASFAVTNDFKHASSSAVVQATGLPFKPASTHYPPWRNYSRVLKAMLLVSDSGDHGKPSPVAQLLATPGTVTCDEYFHFFARTFTEPSPARKQYTATAQFRYPLLFSLKYLLAKAAASHGQSSATIDEIISAYVGSKFRGDEGEVEFIKGTGVAWPQVDRTAATYRQARESLLVLCQISYLHCDGEQILVALDAKDATEIFADLSGIQGPFDSDPEEEIRRRGALFSEGSTDTFFDYPNTVLAETVERGFAEGTKVQKTHITIERNRQLREAFFKANPTTECDVCRLLTKKTYSWTERVLDLHHLLPLASGTRMDLKKGTLLDDLVPICPSCHRAVHRFYDNWLHEHLRADFSDSAEAKAVYGKMKAAFSGPHHA